MMNKIRLLSFMALAVIVSLTYTSITTFLSTKDKRLFNNYSQDNIADMILDVARMTRYNGYVIAILALTVVCLAHCTLLKIDDVGTAVGAKISDETGAPSEADVKDEIAVPPAPPPDKGNAEESAEEGGK